MYKHLLVATDGSELGGKALAQGCALAKTLGANVTILTVVEPPISMSYESIAAAEGSTMTIDEYTEIATARAKKIVAEAEAEARKAGVTCDSVLANGNVAENIIDQARAKKCDLIVMSSHGRRGLSRFFLGSQASAVVTHSSIPVLICR